MFVLRATNRLLKRIGAPSSGGRGSTTALGDWYGNLVRVGSTQLVLCTSDQSLLSVVVPARQVRERLVENLRAALRDLLASIGVPSDAAEAELERMGEHRVDTTASRKVLGHMRDFGLYLDAALKMDPDIPLGRLGVELSRTPCGPSKYFFPAERGRQLLEERQRRRTSGCS